MSANLSRLRARSARRRNVEPRDIIHHHPVRAEPPPERADCALDAANPPAGQSVLIAVVIKRDHLIAEYADESRPVVTVVNVRVGVRFSRANREPVLTVVGFRPPS